MREGFVEKVTSKLADWVLPRKMDRDVESFRGDQIAEGSSQE